MDHRLISRVPSAQHAIFVLKVEGPLSAELSRVNRLAEVIKFLFRHDFLFGQRRRHDFIRWWSSAWLALPQNSLYAEEQVVGVVDLGCFVWKRD